MVSLNRTSSKVVLIFLLIFGSGFGQYWQQWVEYDMDIILDTEKKILTGTSDLIYVNHSPDTLHQMLMHLYHNAFNEGTIAQEVWEYDYNESIDMDKGWTGIKVAKATVDSVELDFTIRDDTILDIQLKNDLAPGDTLQFHLDWKSIIHPHIDRSGWKAQQFDFAQWYPKFVVYDENGWHDDPFGDWGEFYGEIGNFRVKMDLPMEQVVGATGVVSDGDPGWSDVSVDTSRNWDEWVAEFREDRGKYLAGLDSADRRQVTFVAENVHDFAWLCSPDFVYENGFWKDVEIHVLYTTQVGKQWTKDVVEYGKSAIQWLSEKFGMYPWPQMTVTKALLSGGMEYPMLIMDASESESLTVHEIGHNWFYAILGNDELDDAWMDEGFTSFQTRWYKEHHYPDNGYDITRNNITQFEHDNLPRQMYQEAALKPVIRFMTSCANEPIATRSYNFSSYASYRDNVYDKASIMLDMLKNYLGEERFLMGMRLYYSRWALKHVNEARFIKAMEDASGEELDWFFDQWLHTTHYVDYKLSDWQVKEHDQDHFTTMVNMDNLGGMFVPMSATVFGKHGETASATVEEFRFRSRGSVAIESDFRPDYVILDPDNVFFDVDRRNNSSQRERAWRYNYKGWDAYPDDRNLYLWKPRFGYSDLAGTGLGVQIKRVYRNTGNYLMTELDHNLGSGNPDVSVSFKKLQIGLPFKATAFGEAKVWRSMTHVFLAYELNWAKRFWANPIHYLTLRLEKTDASHANLNPADRVDFTRLGIQYDYQNDLLGGDYGFTMNAYTSPRGLGGYGEDFSQISLMSNWKRYYPYFNINNRMNLLTNYGATPDMIKSRLASQDIRSVYLNRMASSLHNIENAEIFGSRYYLKGGGRMRGYSDSLDISANFIWSNNTDILLRSVSYVPNTLDFGMFFDVGQYSQDGSHWKTVSDLGFALTYKPTWARTSWASTIFRPVKVKLELSMMRYEDGAWVNRLSANPWVFTISN